MQGHRRGRLPATLSAAAFCLFSITGPAATLNVPGQYANIGAALDDANDGDEIRVQSGHVDESVWLEVSNKSVAIRSYNSDYSEPEYGALWFGFTDTEQNEGYAIQLENATLTVEGFSVLSCLDCSMFVVGNNSTLNVDDCYFTGTGQANTAAIDTGPMGGSSAPETPVENVTINVSNSTFEENGRGVWTRSIQGTTELNIDNVEITANSSWAIEYRVGAGDHTMNFSNSILQTNANRTMRLYAFYNQNPSLVTNYTVNVDRVYFDLRNAARAAAIDRKSVV